MRARPKKVPLEVCILAGGLSTRMGRDKSRLKIGGVTMLARIRQVATLALREQPPARIRIIRKDRVPRCGPLGGIVTALRTTRAAGILFLACDMPLISPALLKRMIRTSRGGECATFAAQRKRVGFPFVLPAGALPAIEQQITAQEFSLYALAAKLRARQVIVPARNRELLNVNTPKDAAIAHRLSALQIV